MSSTKSLADMQAEVVAWCESKGWREDKIPFPDAMALLHTEIAEASDAWRIWGLRDATAPVVTYNGQPPPGWTPPKPEGVGSEFADILIRLLDDCDQFKVSLQAEISRQGEGAFAVSDSFLANMNTLHTMTAKAAMAWEDGEWGFTSQFASILIFLRQLCVRYGIDLTAEYERKMKFNATRPYKHGNKRR